MSTIIDDKTKAYLIACLVTGIDIKEQEDVLMDGIVAHLNSTDRYFYATGDRDGIIVHDTNDVPLMSLLYNGNTLKFNTFEPDEFGEVHPSKMIGFALLNIIGYFQINDYEFYPSIVASQQTVNKIEINTRPEDWAL